MRVLHVVAETPLSFLQHLKDITYIERRPLRYAVLFCYVFFYTLTEFRSLGSVLNDCSLSFAHWN